MAELLATLRWWWRLIAFFSLAVLAGAAWYAESVPPQFDAQSIVSVSPRAETGVVSADLIRLEAPKYLAYMTAPATVRRVAGKSHILAGDLSGALAPNLATDTAHIVITVRLASPGSAARAANAVAMDVVAFSRGDPLLRVDPIALADVPTTPAWPPRRLIEAAALFVGLLVAVPLAVLLETQRPRIRSSQDIGSLTGYPVIGRIPYSRAIRRRKRPLADPGALVAVRALRVNLRRLFDSRPHGVLLVTSAVDGEGKTAIAEMLARSLASLDLRVLLVDADLRRAGLSNALSRKAAPDLAAALRGEAGIEEVVQTSGDVSLLATRPDAEAENLLVHRFAGVLAAAREAYDLVIIDGPPLIPVPEAPTIASLADRVLLVVAVGTPAPVVAEAAESLQAVKAEAVSAVANRLRRTPGEGHRGYSAVISDRLGLLERSNR